MYRQRTKLFTTALFTAAGAVSFSLLSGGCSKMKESVDDATLRIPMQTNPAHIDPAKCQDDYSGMVTTQVFEGLVTRDQDGHVVPCIAEKWEIKDGGKTYVFTLKQGVTFSNGHPVTADDFKYSLERAADPKLKSPMVETYLGDIVGLSDKVHGKASSISGIRVIDAKTLEITIDKPRPYFLGKLAYPVSDVVDKQVAKSDQEMLDAKELIGTGPFTVSRYVEDQLVDLDANPTYWAGKAKIEHVHMPIIKDAITRLNEFKAGHLDAVQIQPKDYTSLKGDPKYASEIQNFPRAGVDYIAFNTKSYPPFADRRVRRAIMMAIDRENLVNVVLGGVFKVANGILPEEVLGHRASTAILSYDPAKARAELAEAGYPGGKGLPPLGLMFNTNLEQAKLLSQSVQDDLKKNLGIDLTVKPIEFSTFLDEINKKTVPFYTLAWLADYTDPQNFLSSLLTTAGTENRSNYSNAEVDRLYAEADQLPEKDPKRLADYAKAEDLLLQDAAWVPVYFTYEPWLVSSRVKGIRHAFFGWLPYTEVTLK